MHDGGCPRVVSAEAVVVMAHEVCNGHSSGAVVDEAGKVGAASDRDCGQHPCTVETTLLIEDCRQDLLQWKKK